MPRGNVRVSITADDQTSRGLRSAEANISRFGHSATTTQEKVSKGFLSGAAAAAKFAATSAGIASVGVAITKVGQNTIGFDKAMRNVNSIAQLSEKNLGSLEKQVLSLAGKTAQAPETLANGLYDLVSSGFDAKQSMLILASSAKAATAGLTTTEISTKAVAAVLNAYHRPAKDAAQISDDLFQTVNRGVISFETLASSIGDVLPFASSLQINLKAVGAAISTMTKEGLSGEEATTRLKNVMVALLKPSDGMSRSLKQLGFDSGEALVKAKGFQGAIEALIGTTNGSKAAIAQLFPNIRALGGALALTGTNTKSAEADLRAFQHTGGATDKALSQQSKSIAYNWNKLKATFSAWSIEAGYALISAGRAVSDFVQKNRAAFDRFASGVTAIFHGFTEGVRGMVKIVTGLLTLNLGRAFSGVKDIARGALDQTVGVFKVFTSPFAGAARSLVSSFKSGFRGITGWASNLGHAIVNAIVDAIKSAPGAIGDAIKSIVPSPVKSVLKKAGGAASDVYHFLGGASGGLIAGPRGAGDIVPMMLKPGEVVLTEDMQHALGRDRVLTTVSALGGKILGPGGKARTGGVIGPQTVSKMQSYASSMAARNFPYVFGGGHSGFGPSGGGFDCSGFVSAILGVGGAISSPMAVREPLASALVPGPGRFVTVGIRGSSGRNAHTMIKVGNQYFESGGGGNGAHRRSGWNGAFEFFHPRNEATSSGPGGVAAPGGLTSAGANGRRGFKITGRSGNNPAAKSKTPTYGQPMSADKLENFYSAALTNAQITTPDDTSDDLTVLNAWKGYETGAYNAAVATGDTQGIIQHGGALTDINTQIDAITNPPKDDTTNQDQIDALNALNAQLQQMNDLLTQQAADRQKLLNVSQSQYAGLFAGFVDAISGGIGGRVGLGFMTPSTAGSFASY